MFFQTKECLCPDFRQIGNLSEVIQKYCFHVAGDSLLKTLNLKEDLDEDESNNELELGEPPPYELQKRLDNRNILLNAQAYAKQQRYKCHSCEPPDCSNPTTCVDAIQCWKSRVRESSGDESLQRGCTSNAEQLPLMCRTPSFAAPRKRHAVGQYHIECCTGDFCNNGDFPELDPLHLEEVGAYSESFNYVLKLIFAVLGPVLVLGVLAAVVLLLMRRFVWFVYLHSNNSKYCSYR